MAVRWRNCRCNYYRRRRHTPAQPNYRGVNTLSKWPTPYKRYHAYDIIRIASGNNQSEDHMVLEQAAFLDLGAPELIIILAIVLLLFGGSKLPQLSRSLGTSMRELRSGLNGDKHEKSETQEKRSDSTS